MVAPYCKHHMVCMRQLSCGLFIQVYHSGIADMLGLSSYSRSMQHVLCICATVLSVLCAPQNANVVAFQRNDLRRCTISEE